MTVYAGLCFALKHSAAPLPRRFAARLLLTGLLLVPIMTSDHALLTAAYVAGAVVIGAAEAASHCEYLYQVRVSEDLFFRADLGTPSRWHDLLSPALPAGMLAMQHIMMQHAMPGCGFWPSIELRGAPFRCRASSCIC